MSQVTSKANNSEEGTKKNVIINEDDTISILVATDNHLGFMEKDPVRGNDTFTTFEEILQIAKDEEVDFILLGGDLFHLNKPSRSTLYKTIELLRKYCFGDKAVNVEILSDQAKNFHTKFGSVNYEDPNFNIAIPVFSIHGNHDDPAGEGRLAALDLLSVCNMVNYFGKSDNIDDVTVYPILMKKGSTKIAIYGLGNIRDERLYRTFQQKKVRLMRPVEAKDEWFNIFVMHQNRVAHNPKNYIHENMLDAFLDFVIWGHEHECHIIPQPSTVGQFYITQPGSSVATALSEGEAKKKHIGILDVCHGEFRLRPIPLNTVRPFMMDEVVLASMELDPNDSEAVVEFLASKVDDMIAKATEESGNNKQKPLLRLKVEYTGFTTCNPQRFGQRFVGKVANPNDILLFYKKKTTTGRAKSAKDTDKDVVLKNMKPDPLDNVRIEDLIESFLSDSAKALEILPEAELHNALHQFVEKHDKNAITEFVNKTLNHTRKFLANEEADKTLQPEVIQAIVSERTAAKRMEHQQNMKMYDADEANNSNNNNNDTLANKVNEEEHFNSGDEGAEVETKKSKSKPASKKSTQKKSTKKKSTAPAKRGRKAKNFEPLQIVSQTKDSDDDEDGPSEIAVSDSEDEDQPVKKKSKHVKTEEPVEAAEEEQQSTSTKKRRITSLTDVLSMSGKKSYEDGDTPASNEASGVDVKQWGKKKKK